MQLAKVLLYWIVGSYTCSASGIVLSPTVLAMNIENNRFGQVVVTNNSTQRLPLETVVLKLTFKDDGSYETYEVDDSPLSIFPPAAILAPGSKQIFRVQWLDERLPRESKSYFVRFAELQLSDKDDNVVSQTGTSTGVRVQVNYNALIHIYSNTHQPDIILTVDEAGGAILKNKGNRFTYSRLLQFDDLTNDTQSTLSSAIGEIFIPPNSSLDIFVDESLPAGEYHGQER